MANTEGAQRSSARGETSSAHFTPSGNPRPPLDPAGLALSVVLAGGLLYASRYLPYLDPFFHPQHKAAGGAAALSAGNGGSFRPRAKSDTGEDAMTLPTPPRRPSLAEMPAPPFALTNTGLVSPAGATASRSRFPSRTDSLSPDGATRSAAGGFGSTRTGMGSLSGSESVQNARAFDAAGTAGKERDASSAATRAGAAVPLTVNTVPVVSANARDTRNTSARLSIPALPLREMATLLSRPLGNGGARAQAKSGTLLAAAPTNAAATAAAPNTIASWRGQPVTSGSGGGTLTISGGVGVNGTNGNATTVGTAGAAGAAATVNVPPSTVLNGIGTLNLVGGNGGNGGVGYQTGTVISPFIPHRPIPAGNKGGDGGAGGEVTLNVGDVNALAGLSSLNMTGGSKGSDGAISLYPSGISRGGAGGAVTLALNFSTTGNTVVTGADVTLQPGGGSATIALNGNNLSLGGLDAAGTVQNSNTVASLLTVGSDNGNHSFGGSITGNLSLAKVGSGTLTLGGGNTFTGTTQVRGGTLTLGNSLALQDSTLDYNNYGGSVGFGTLTAATFSGLSGGQNLALTNANNQGVALTLGGSNASTSYSGALSGSGSVVTTGPGNVTLSGNNTFTGGLTVNGSVNVTLSGNNTFTGGLTVIVPNIVYTSTPVTLNLNAANAAGNGAVTMSFSSISSATGGPLTVNVSATDALAGVTSINIAGNNANANRYGGATTLNLAASNTARNLQTVTLTSGNGGQGIAGSDGGTGGAFTVNASASRVLAGAANVTMVAGAGGDGDATGGGSYDGSAGNGGTFMVNATGAYAFSGIGTIMMAAGSGGYHGFDATGNTLGGAFTMNASAEGIFSGVAIVTMTGGFGGPDGGGAFTINVTNTDALSGANTLAFSGGDGGDRVDSSPGGAGGITTLALDFTTTGNTVNTGADILLKAGTNGTSGVGGSAVVTLNGNNLTVGGIDSGTVNTGNTANLASQIVQNTSSSASSTFTVGDSGTHTYNGLIVDGGAGALAFVKQGSGFQTLTGANTFTGGTSVNAGTLAAMGTALGTGAVGVAAGATLAVGEAANTATGAQATSTLSLASPLTVAGGSGASAVPSLTFNLGTSGTSDKLVLGGASGSLLSFSGNGVFDIGFASATGGSLSPGTYTLLTFSTPHAGDVAGLDISSMGAANKDFAAVTSGNLGGIQGGQFAWTFDSSGNVTGLNYSLIRASVTASAATPEPDAASLLLTALLALPLTPFVHRRCPGYGK